MNLWLKINPNFDSDEALEKFLSEAAGLIVLFDAPARYFFADIPKFLIYALVMYMPTFGHTSELPFMLVGKQDTFSTKQMSEAHSQTSGKMGTISYKAGLQRWRQQRQNKNRPLHV